MSIIGKIVVDASELAPLSKLVEYVATIGADKFPKTREAIMQSLRGVQYTMGKIVGSKYNVRSGGTVAAITEHGVIELERGQLFGIFAPDTTAAPQLIYLNEGVNPFDIKEGLLASHKAKVSKEGRRYIRIVFRHATPGKGGGEAATIPSTMPRGIYEQARHLGEGEALRTPLAQMLGMRSKRVGAYAGKGETRGAPKISGGGTLTRFYTWKSGQFAGMRHSTTPGHGKYATFRTVSEASDPNSWIHPGIVPGHFVDETVRETEPMVVKLISDGLLADLAEATGV